ncbi:MAG TPA: extracellular solute-binding protein, partial [Burkholderiaceae bacterium]|nr:extracellular solute-binding protein [Burkholderiaceae bacterium]
MQIPSHEADRRAFLRSLSGTALAGISGLSLSAHAASPALPSSPVAINVMDVGGALALIQPAFEDYKNKYPNLASRIGFIKAPAPELASKLKAQQAAGRMDIDLVLTGSDGLASGLEQDLWMKILPEHDERFPNLESNYEPAALNLHKVQGRGFGVVCNYYPSGPLLEYAPERVKNVPTTADELLAWAKANPKRFMYARPANSGPGRTFMMGLPYLLKDKDPKDPDKGWEKT